MSYTYSGESFFEGIRERVTVGIGEAANILKDELKELISIQGPPRSKPGESPHKDTGDLYASIEVIGPAVQEDTVIASVGTQLPQGLWMEYGTGASASDPKKTKNHATGAQIGGIAPRPWLSKGLIQSQEHLASRIFGK